MRISVCGSELSRGRRLPDGRANGGSNLKTTNFSSAAAGGATQRPSRSASEHAVSADFSEKDAGRVSAGSVPLANFRDQGSAALSDLDVKRGRRRRRPGTYSIPHLLCGF